MSEDTARDRLYDRCFGSLRGSIENELDKHKDKLGSPIEALFLEALLAWHASALLALPKIDGTASKTRTNVNLQEIIGRYRVDFLVQFQPNKLIRSPIRCVVECDGHEFHERTKEQAARDRKRDRDLQSDGYIILRFTGSQIHQDAFGCVDELMGCILQAVKRQWPADNLPTADKDQAEGDGDS